MAGECVFATMRPMNERSVHCVDAIAAVNCTLQAALGRFERCPGARCSFWEDAAAKCVLDGAKQELLRQPNVAEHLLELRYALDAARDADGEAGVRSRFRRLLNEEQEAEWADAWP